ncbi:MAG: tetratricopeptide repeat protein, partial [Candidatus Aminicenantes bacterium]|nr:tetratricopeptide repeat protein [Candidatus Aminicenantes bacterium]
MKKFFIIINIFFLFFIFAQQLLSQEIKTTKEVKKLNQQYYPIRKLMSEKKFNIAYTKYKDFIVQNHDFYEVYLFFPRCAKKIDKLNSAIDFFKKLLKKEPKNTYFYYGLGVCYETQKNYDKAADNYEKATNLQAKFLAVYYRR